MKNENHITGSCIISHSRMYKNGKPVFENAAVDLPGFLLAAYRHFEIQYPKFHKMDNLCKLGWLANEILLQANYPAHKYQPHETGIVLSNANSSLDTDIRYFETVKTIASPAQFVYTLPNIVMGEIAIRHNFKGENAFFIFEDFDADFIEQYVSNLLNNDILQCCICGWVELLEEHYHAALFLVEKEKSADSVTFTGTNLQQLFAVQQE